MEMKNLPQDICRKEEAKLKVQSIVVFNLLLGQLGTEDVSSSPCGRNFFYVHLILQSVRQSQGYFLSCSGQLKTRVLNLGFERDMLE